VTVRRMMPDERRALILRAARDLFSQRPYAEVPVADIARAAGVSPPLIVFHFGSKRSLYLAVLEAAAAAIRAGLNELPGPPSLDRLRAGVRFYADYSRTHRTGFLSLLRGGQDVAEAAALVEAFRDELARQILADLTAVRRDEEAAEVLTLLAVRGYLGYVEAVIVHWLALPEDQRDQVSVDMIADMAAGAFSGGFPALA
jgi:AcrR family transcriptional regulator